MSESPVRVAQSSQIQEGRSLALRVNGEKIVIFRFKNRLYALRNRCPHQGAPLSDGALHNDHVVCLYHGWRFKLENGAFSGNPNLKIRTFPVFEQDGEVFLTVNNSKS